MLPEDTFILNDDGTITLKPSVVSGMEPALARDVYDALGELLRKWR